jgi:hypothetical protein
MRHLEAQGRSWAYLAAATAARSAPGRAGGHACRPGRTKRASDRASRQCGHRAGNIGTSQSDTGNGNTGNVDTGNIDASAIDAGAAQRSAQRRQSARQ